MILLVDKFLAKEMESSDAFIVLLPADVTKDVYKVNLQVFKTRLETLLEKIHKINPYIPVCLAVNKWDMFDRSYDSINEVLQERPYKDFNNMLQRECGEHYFYQAISAFGQNRSSEGKTEQEREQLREEWDRQAEPVNVMQMLLSIADKAENSRYKSLREKYQHSFKVTKVLQYPFVFLNTFLKGANRIEDRAFCTGILIKCMSALAALIVSVFTLCFAFVGTFTSLGEYAYLSFQGNSISEIEKSFDASETDNTTASTIQELKDKLEGHPVKLAFFCGKKKTDLDERIQKIEEKYNTRLLHNAQAFCKKPNINDAPPKTMKSSERQKRCYARIKHYEQEKAKLTGLLVREADGRTIQDHFDGLIKEEKQQLSDISADRVLDDALYALNTTKAEDKCVYIETLLDKYEHIYAHRKDDFKQCRKDLEDTENAYHAALMKDLEEFKDLSDPHDFDGRVARAERRIKRIKQEVSHLSSRSKWHQTNNNMLVCEQKRITEWKHDKTFFIAYREVMNLPLSGKISKIIEFQNRFPKSSYSRCTKEWDAAENKKNQLIKNVNDTLTKELTKLDLNAKGLSADEKVNRFESAIVAYGTAMQENPTESDSYAAEIKKLKLLIPQAKRDISFETEFNNVKNAPSAGKLKKIHAFLSSGKFVPANYPHKAADYEQLKKMANQILNQLNSKRKSAEKKYADDPKFDRTARLSNAKFLKNEYEGLLVEYLPSSAEYDNLADANRKLQQTIVEHCRYKKLADDFEKIKQLHDRFAIIQEIAIFEANAHHVQSDYPLADGVMIFTELDRIKKANTDAIIKEYSEKIAACKRPTDKTDFSGLAEYFQNCLVVANDYRGKIGEGNGLSAWILTQTTQFSNNVTKYQRFVRIAMQVNKLADDSSIKDVEFAKNRLIAIRAFLQNSDWAKTLNDEPELNDLANRFRRAHTDVEDYIGNHLSNELNKIEKSLSPDATQNDKMDNWEKQMNLIEVISK